MKKTRPPPSTWKCALLFLGKQKSTSNIIVEGNWSLRKGTWTALRFGNLENELYLSWKNLVFITWCCGPTPSWISNWFFFHVVIFKPCMKFTIHGFIFKFLASRDGKFHWSRHSIFNVGKCEDGRIPTLHVWQQTNSTILHLAPLLVLHEKCSAKKMRKDVVESYANVGQNGRYVEVCPKPTSSI